MRATPRASALLALAAVLLLANPVATLTVRERFVRVLGLTERKAQPASDAVLVVGAGFGRTGTASLKAALETLGFRTHHMLEVYPSASQSSAVIEYLKGNDPGAEKFINRILADGFNATTDFPACLIWEELANKFPQSKVVLTTRESPQQWFRSFSTLMSMSAVFNSLPFRRMSLPMTAIVHNILSGNCSYEDVMWEPWYMPWVSLVTERRLNEPECIAFYTNHVAKVRAAVPKDRLLDFSVKQGWGPLCDFLRVPVPDTPFPNSNSSEDLLSFRVMLTAIAVAYPLVVLVPLFALWRCCRPRRALKAKTQ